MMKSHFRITLYFLCLLGTVILLSLLINHATADEIVVDVNGNGDFTSIQEAIDSSSIGDTIRIWSGTYEEHLIINRSCTLIGNGSSLSRLDAPHSFIIKVASDNVTIRGIGICNSTFDFGGYSFGIIGKNVTGCTIVDCSLYGNAAGISFAYSDRIIIINNSFSRSVRGIVLSSCSNSSVGFNSIDIYGNLILPYRESMAVVLDFCINNNIYNNTINSHYGISLFQTSNDTITGNIGNQGVTIDYYARLDTSNLVIDDTNLVNGKPIICLIGVSHYTVPSDAGQVILIDCDEVTVSGSNMSCTSPIHVIGSTDCKIVRNSISCSYLGIVLTNSSRITISNNLVTFIDQFSGYNVMIMKSENNTIIRNQFEGCQMTIMGENNYIYHNNFIDCFGFQHWSSSCRFNLSYPGGGNYYNNIELIDEFSGKNQTEDGPDGFVDEPFIEHIWMDFYPLMEPVDISVEEGYETENDNAILLIVVAGVAGAVALAVIIWAWRRRPR